MAEPAEAIAALVLVADVPPVPVAAITRQIDTLREAGCEPVVVVGVALDGSAYRKASIVTVRSGATLATALRQGLARLANVPVRAVLVAPLGAHARGLDADAPPLDRGAVSALADAWRQTRATLVLPTVHGQPMTPFVVGRDGWLELMAVVEEGLGAVFARLAPRGVELALEPRPIDSA